MLHNNFRKGGAQHDKGRGSARFQKPPQREELKVSAKMASPGCLILQYKTDGAHDVTVWLKRLSVVAMRECPAIGRLVEGIGVSLT